MTHVTCRLTAKNRDQLRNPALGNRVRAAFTFFYFTSPDCRSTIEQWNCGLTADRNRNSQTPRHTTQQSFLCHSRYAHRGRPDDAVYVRRPILCASLRTSFRLQFSARIHRITFRRGNITAAALSRYFIRTVLQLPRVQ